VPYAFNDDIRIYYETEGSGPPLLFTHGCTSTHQVWREYGYVQELQDDYTVILYDMRGHGQSDKPHRPDAYDYRLMVSDALAVLDALHIQRTHFWGYSMGGAIGFGLAELAPQHLRSLILGGCQPEDDGKPPPSEMLVIMCNGLRDGADAAIQGMRELYGKVDPGYEARLRSVDYQAIVALMERWEYHLHGFTAVLPTMTMPCLVYTTADEDLTKTPAWVAQLPNATFFVLDGNHLNADFETELSKGKAFLAQQE
jgi:pimeloyl-ACP methyl ester carboxylesterase